MKSQDTYASKVTIDIISPRSNTPGSWQTFKFWPRRLQVLLILHPSLCYACRLLATKQCIAHNTLVASNHRATSSSTVAARLADGLFWNDPHEMSDRALKAPVRFIHVASHTAPFIVFLGLSLVVDQSSAAVLVACLCALVRCVAARVDDDECLAHWEFGLEDSGADERCDIVGSMRGSGLYREKRSPRLRFIQLLHCHSLALGLPQTIANSN